MSVTIEPMQDEDWERVREIYLEGISSGLSTFETGAPPWDRWNASHFAHSRWAAKDNGRVIGWAALSPVSSRACYAGVAEVSVYVAASHRKKGIGTLLLRTSVRSSEENGIWTLNSSAFRENTGSLRMQAACGFRVVGHRERIAQLHGVWHDTTMTERRSTLVGV